MSLVGVGGAFVAACVADLRGDHTTRPFTRPAFLLFLAFEAGVLSGLVSFAAGIGGALGGLL